MEVQRFDTGNGVFTYGTSKVKKGFRRISFWQGENLMYQLPYADEINIERYPIAVYVEILMKPSDKKEIILATWIFKKYDKL